jgi:peptide deformylase
MTKEDIISLPNVHLRVRSKKVGMIDDAVLQLIADMENATLDWEASREHEVGVALAAVQIDQLMRIVVVREDFDDKSNHNFNILINPEITKYEGKITDDFEGCLSIPDIYGKVPRYEKVRVKALNIDSKQIRVTAEGFLARVLQHEIDHTNGIVFIDHIKDQPGAFFKIMSDGHLEPQDYASDIKENAVLWPM